MALDYRQAGHKNTCTFKKGNVFTYRAKYNLIYSYENVYTLRATEHTMLKDFAHVVRP